jgi:hypothetical protein
MPRLLRAPAVPLARVVLPQVVLRPRVRPKPNPAGLAAPIAAGHLLADTAANVVREARSISNKCSSARRS